MIFEDNVLNSEKDLFHFGEKNPIKIVQKRAFDHFESF